jgi:integrase
MGRRGKSRKVTTNVYADLSGISIKVQVRGARRELRFPPGTDLATLQKNRDQLRADLHDEAPLQSERGTLAADAVRYLRLTAGKPGSKAVRSHVQAWVDRLGNKHRSRITPDDVRLALAAWRTSGVYRSGCNLPRATVGRPASETTLQRRWQTLRDLYRVLDGSRTRTPCDDVPQPKCSKPTPVGVPAEQIQRVIVTLARRAQHTAPNSLERKDHARFLMLVTTGQRPVQVMRAQGEDFDLAGLTWMVRAAKGGPSHAIPLNAEMYGAVRLFLASEALGLYDTTRFARILRANGWPAGVRPYNARHSLAIDALAQGADLGDIQALLGHTSIETTRRAYAPVLLARQRAVSQRLEGRLRVDALDERDGAPATAAAGNVVSIAGRLRRKGHQRL